MPSFEDLILFMQENKKATGQAELKTARQLGKMIREINRSSQVLDVDQRSTVGESAGATLMTLAGRYGLNACIRILVKDFGANVNAVDQNGWSPPMECAAYVEGLENLTGVAYLVQNGADPWHKGRSTFAFPDQSTLITSKHLAVLMKNPVVFSYLHSIGRPVLEDTEACAVCTEGGGEIVGCSHCPRWYHLDCIGTAKAEVSQTGTHE
jgi:hypothetical protein